jgi:hypothetical protein
VSDLLFPTPGRVEIPVTSGSAQAPDFARTKALTAFDAVRTSKRTPLEVDIGVDVHGGLQNLDSVAEENWVVIR